MSGMPKVRQWIALISDHGDPAAEIGSEEAGGQNVYVRCVGERLAALGWQVDMFTRKVHPDDANIVQHAPRCRTIRLIAGPERFVPRDEIFPYMPQFVQAFEEFRHREGIQYAVIHTNYWLSAWVGLQLKQRCAVPLVHTYHSLGAVKYQTMLTLPAIAPTRLKVEHQILEQATCVIATSPQEHEDLRTLVATTGRIEVVPYGTDLENFRVMSRFEARSRLALDANEQIVLYVGRFDPRKGIETLVRACAQSQAHAQGKLRLLIVGGSHCDRLDGFEHNRIEQIVQAVGLAKRTMFVGRVEHQELAFYYSSANVCVVPSHYEPFGLVAIEAMACGIPIVASNIGGLRFSVVSGQTGLLVPPKDTAGFADAIDQVLANETWADQMGQSGAVRVQQQFSWTQSVNQLNNLYQCLQTVG